MLTAEMKCSFQRLRMFQCVCSDRKEARAASWTESSLSVVIVVVPQTRLTTGQEIRVTQVILFLGVTDLLMNLTLHIRDEKQTLILNLTLSLSIS